MGLDRAPELLEEIPGKVRQKLGLTVDVNLHEEAGKQYLEVAVKPQSVAVSLRGRYYYRSGSTKTELTGVSLNEFLLKKSGTTWDCVIEPNATLADIDEKSVFQFLRDAEHAGRLPHSEGLSTAELLEKLRLIRDGQITRAALVLFGKDPGAYFHSLSIKLGRFETDTDIRFQEVIEDNLIRALPAVLEQLDLKFFVKTISFEGIRRIETPPYPREALRELFLNAMVHRRYSSSTVQVRIYGNHMTIWNEGPLPEAVPLESLMGPHASVPRNPLIADVCFKAGYIDSWGRGIQKITGACHGAGLPDPRFEEAFDGFLVTLSPTPTATKEAHEKAHEEAHDILAQVEYRVLNACLHESRSTPELLQNLGYASRTGSFKKAMSHLLNLHYISMTIPASPRSRNQRYRLTAAGRSLLLKSR